MLPLFKRLKRHLQKLLGDSINEQIFNAFAWKLVHFNSRQNAICNFKKKDQLSLDFKKNWLLLDVEHILEFLNKKS